MRLLNGYPRRAGGTPGYRRAYRPDERNSQTLRGDFDDSYRDRGMYRGGSGGLDDRDRNYYRFRMDQDLQRDVTRWRSDKKARKLLDSMRVEIRARNYVRFFQLASRLARRLTALGRLVDLGEIIAEMLAEGDGLQPSLPQRPHTVWGGQFGWEKTTDCAPPAGNVSPFHYPQAQGSSCLTLWSNLVSERNFYFLQTISGQTYRTFRLMEQAQLGIEGPPPIDRGRTLEQWRMLESTFQSDPVGYRRYGSEYQRAARGRTADQYLAQIHPNLLPFHPVPTPQPLPPNSRPINEWPEGPQGGNEVPGPGTGGGTSPPVVTPPGSVPAISVGGNVGGGNAGRWNGMHHKRRPGRHEKEVKFRGRAERIMHGVMAGLTEYVDFQTAVKEALPLHIQRRVGNDPFALAQAVWDNWTPELAAQIFANVTYNALEDAIAGRAIGKARKWGGAHQNPFTGARRVSSAGGRAVGELRFMIG